MAPMITDARVGVCTDSAHLRPAAVGRVDLAAAINLDASSGRATRKEKTSARRGLQIPGGPDAVERDRRHSPGEMVEEFDIELEASDDDVLVHGWRVEQLARLGISAFIADAVATFVDWHEIARLVQQGC